MTKIRKLTIAGLTLAAGTTTAAVANAGHYCYYAWVSNGWYYYYAWVCY